MQRKMRRDRFDVRDLGVATMVGLVVMLFSVSLLAAISRGVR
jgi:hypothetical protein